MTTHKKHMRDLQIGDRFRYPHADPTTIVAVLRDPEPTLDRFGRDMLRIWARDEQTDREGWVTFGPSAAPVSVLDIPCQIWVCTDCLFLLANGDTPPEMSEEETDAWIEGMPEEEITLGLLSENHDCEDPDSCDGDGCETKEFSWSRCGCCGSGLGGSRHAAVLWLAPENVIEPQPA